jgi:uncharacterized iron-regulated membrane protein
MTPGATRLLLAIHRWTGVITTLNVLLFSVTGLVLVFREEIDAALGAEPEAEQGEVQTSLTETIELARVHYRETHDGAEGAPRLLFQNAEDHPGLVFVTSTEPTDTGFDTAFYTTVDRVKGEVLADFDFDDGFTAFVYHLHADLFAGPLGTLFLGAVGLAFLVSIVTGAIVYGPIMRRFSFGLVRRGGRKNRITWADVHKLTGVATFGWLLIVVTTGVLLSIGGPLLQLYQNTELAALGAPYADDPVVSDYGSIEDAVATALAAQPNRVWEIIALPGSPLASPRHYSVLTTGSEGVDSRVYTVALVDALAPESLELRLLPVYLRALLISEPLHFGDYAGLPLKILWSFFTLATMLVTIAGLYSAFAAGRFSRGARGAVRAGDDASIPLDDQVATAGGAT